MKYKKAIGIILIAIIVLAIALIASLLIYFGGTSNKTYTWEEFEALSQEEQVEFQNSFKSQKGFEKWMVKAQKNISLPWKERKIHTIEHIKNAPLGSKLIVACDKISNLEDALANIEKYGEDKVINRNPEEQRWYYTSVYNSCIQGVDEEHPIFKRYKYVLNKIFNI